MYSIFHICMNPHSHGVILRPLDVHMPPYELYKALAERFENSFILESAVGDSRTVAYSFLGFGPECILRCSKGKVEGGEGLDHLRQDPLEFLRSFLRGRRIKDQTFSYLGGLVGYLSYEFASLTEDSFVGKEHRDFPVFELGYYPEGVVYDHSNFRAFYFGGEDGELLKALDATESAEDPRMRLGPPKPDTSQQDFEEEVDEAKSRILAGEAFQIVLSRGLEHEYDGNPLALYSALRATNPSPYMFYLDHGPRKVFGSSPETLVSLRKGEMTTFPIAGTRPAGDGAKERRRYREEMLLDEKERSEHCMLVDLARNDLSKVCELDTVHVPEFMSVGSFSHVQHIVSKVQGTLSPKDDAVGALKAVFPAGTVSGAPKPRAMEIIAELEGCPRGPYAGGVGYLSLNGNMDSAITIRSAFCADGRMRLQAGAGIVADSDPAREYLETEHKLRALSASISKLGASS
jgi:anthranilate synthase component I